MYSAALFALFVCAVNSANVKREADTSIFYPTGDPEAVSGGGLPFPPGARNYLATLSTGAHVGTILCGGSVVTSKTVLTTAHCIEAVFEGGALDSSLRVTLGTNRRDGGTAYTLSHNVTHPEYSSKTLFNNIGILVTSSNIVFNNLVQPVTLNYDYHDLGVAVRISGWGKLEYKKELSDLLMDFTMITISADMCVGDVAVAGRQFKVDPPPVQIETEMCVFNVPGHGVCDGSYGSPVMHVDIYEQIGIVSWGFPCSKGAPTVLLRLGPYQEWLKNVIVQ